MTAVEIKYKCEFDFTVIKKGSQFIGKSGVIEIMTDKEIGEEEIEKLKDDKHFKTNIAHHLVTAMKQKNIFMITVTNIEKL